MRRLIGLAAALALVSCGGALAPTVFAIDLQANGGGPLLVTALGGTLQLTAAPQDQNGHALSGLTFTWASGNAAIATVDQTGLVTGVANGTVQITAASGGATGVATLTVAQAANSIAVTPPSQSLERGATATFTAAVTDSHGTAVSGAAVVWASQNTAVLTINAQGVASGVGAGSTTVTATSGSKSATAAVTVTVPAAAAVTVSQAQTGSLTSIDDTRQLSAAATDARGAALPEAAFTWTSSDGTVASVSSAGLVTALKNGTVTVTATSGSAHGTLGVTVAQATHSLDVTPLAQSIAPGASFTFVAHPLDAHGHAVASAPAASWTIDDPIATIDASTGQVLGNANATAVGVTHVHASIGNVSGSAQLTVDPAMAPVVSISLPQPSGSLASLGDTVQLSATARNAANNPVPGVVFSWSSDHPEFASVGAASGLVTAVGNGTATITASGGGKSATATVTVTQVLAAVALTPHADFTFTSLDDTLQLSAAATDANGHPVAGAVVTWSTGNAAIVGVSSTGLATAKANGGPITVTATAGTLHDQVSLSVAQAVNAVNVTPSSDSVAPDSTIDFSAAAVDAHGHLVPGPLAQAWHTNNALVTVSSTGQVTVGHLTTLALVTITATLGGVDGTAQLTVDPALTPVDHVVVFQGGVTLTSIGDTVQLSAQAQDASNVALNRSISWSVQDGSADVVTIGSTGLVTAVGNGTKTLVASSGGKSGTAQVTVSQALNSVQVSSALGSTLTSLGDTLQLSASGFDARGHALAAALSFTWRSDSAHATVNGSGVVTAVSNGGAGIFAASGGVESAAFAVTVAQAVDHVNVSAGGPVTLVSLGDTVQLTATALDARNNPMAVSFTWTPSSGAAAVVNASGLVTAAANGTTSIHAAAQGKTGSIDITVAQAVASVAVSGTASLSSLGQTAQLSAAAFDARANPIAAQGFSWASDSGNVTVGAGTGVITAVANGSANITASLSGFTSPPHAVTVAQVVASISVTGNATLANLGDTTALSAQGFDANGHPVPNVSFTWSVQGGTTDVITVDVSTGVVTAVASGQRTVVASAQGKTGTLLVTVAETVANVTVSAGSSTTLTSIGDTLQLSAAATQSNGNPVSGATFSWRSSNAGVASVSGSGLVTGITNGTVNIFARSGNTESGGFAVTVAQAVATVVVSPQNPFVQKGGTEDFTATGQDARGHAVSGTPAATWQSSNPSTVSIDAGTGHAQNLFSCICAPANVTITATISGKQGSTQISLAGY